MIKPGIQNPPYEIELYDGRSKRAYGLKLDGGIGGLQIGTISQDDTVYVRNVGKRVGDFDEQRSWKAGRGVENLNDNAEGYWDGMNLWSLTQGHIHQTIQWHFAKGLRSADFNMPGDMNWYALVGSGTSKYLSMSWSSSGFSASKAMLWIRRRGTPGTLTLRLHSDNAGSPGTVLQTVTKTVSDVTDVVSILLEFDWTGTQALSASTTYHLSVYGASTDNKANHWEIGGDDTGSTGKTSTDGNTWSSANFDMYYRVTDEDIARRFYAFFIDGAFYLVDRKDDGTTASQLYINGNRGKATAGSATTLTDTAWGVDAADWTTDKWANAYIKIVRGTGKGQVRQISSNTGTVITVSSAWTTTPDNTSEYIIYGTPWFSEITGHGFGVVSGDPVVGNKIAYFPLGDSTVLSSMKVDYTAGTNHVFDAQAAAKASYLLKGYDASGGPQIWRALNDTVSVSRALISPNGNAIAYNDNLSFRPTTGILVGDSTYPITGMAEKDGQVYVFKEDGIYVVADDKAVQLKVGVENTPDPTNGAASLSHQQFLYYSWLHSVIRVYGSSQDDIGQDVRSFGLPAGREGAFAYMDSYLSLTFNAIDAGSSGTSCVLAWDGIGWHEVLRAYAIGKRVRFVKVQPNEGTRNRLWTDIGGELVYQDLPLKKSSPRLDDGMLYQHEAVLESAAIDMGAASGLPKFIKELTVTVRNLNSEGKQVYVDWQVDDDVHTSEWTEATSLLESPESVAYLGLDNVRKFAYRLRINSNDASTPIDIEGIVPNGYARSPFKMMWSMRIKAGGIYGGRGKTVSADKLMRWLLDHARYPFKVEMRSVYEMAHGFDVIIHPARMFPYFPARLGRGEEAALTLVLEEV